MEAHLFRRVGETDPSSAANVFDIGKAYGVIAAILLASVMTAVAVNRRAASLAG